MNGKIVLPELLLRLQSSSNGQLLLGFAEVRRWPDSLLDTMLKQKLIKKIRPAQSLVCPGCEEACCRPVQTFPGLERAFIVCDLRSDISRVPVKLEQLQQWQLSLGAVYKLLSEQSGLAISVLESLPIIWQRVFLYDKQRLAIDSDYLVELSAKLQPAIQPSGNRFVLAGDYWNITFNQKKVAVKNTKGIGYIEYLIRNKGKEVHVSELFYAIDPPDANQIDETLSGMSGAELETTCLSIANLKRNGTAMTPESKRILQNHLKGLTEKIEEAIERGDEDLQGHLEDEQENILQQLAKDFGLEGKPRKSDSLAEQLRKNITNCINKDKKRLQKTFPEFAEHLVFIKTGIFCSYEPNSGIEWQ
jgi:hypothetical protein